MAKKSTKKRVQSKKLSATEKAVVKVKRLHTNAVRRILSGIGFRRVSDISDKQFTFDSQTTDIDDVYIMENIILLIEYTAAQASDVGAHLKNKKLIFDKINDNPTKFLEFLIDAFPSFMNQLPKCYHKSELIVKIVYCSRQEFDEHYRLNVPGPVYLNFPEVQYFTHVVGAINRSARFEFLKFMNIPSEKIGSAGIISIDERSSEFKGSILPESHSNFADGHKVVSFYGNAEVLLRTCYVMRKDGWRDSENLYQRMISKTKIERIRAYLKKEGRVFINNIIVTLPPDVQPLSESKKTIDTKSLNQTAPVIIKIPDRTNSIGIIDGQHRVFAYHETENDDSTIALLRGKQNLLVTGIIYPENLTDIEREKFEARIFLEINSNQTNAKAPLKQAIGMVLDPFSTDSIATKIISALAKQGPLAGFIQRYFWDADKLKTASIVNYGLKPLVKTAGVDSLFHLWTNPQKESLNTKPTDQILKQYIEFCVTNINIVMGAIKANIDKERWTANKKVKGHIVSTTYINAFLIVLRLLIQKNIQIDFNKLKKSFATIDDFEFSAFRSSQYGRMAQKIVEVHVK